MRAQFDKNKRCKKIKIWLNNWYCDSQNPLHQKSVCQMSKACRPKCRSVKCFFDQKTSKRCWWKPAALTGLHFSLSLTTTFPTSCHLVYWHSTKCHSVESFFYCRSSFNSKKVYWRRYMEETHVFIVVGLGLLWYIYLSWLTIDSHRGQIL